MKQTPMALVTGGARRIGLEITKTLHKQGFDVAIHYRSTKEEAKQLEKSLNQQRPDSAKAFFTDFDKPNACYTLIHQVICWKHRLDCLINNASCFLKTPQELALLEQHWSLLFDANAKAPFLLAMHAYPQLKQNKGSIINIGDIHGKKPLKDYSIYSMSKAALLMQTKALALEFGPDVRVNSISPGPILWPEGQNLLEETLKEALINKTCLKKAGHPKYVAKLVCELIDNDYLTGVNIPIDGGRHI